MKTHHSYFTLAALSCALLSACATENSTHTHTETQSHAIDNSVSLDAHYHEHAGRSPGKPSAPISLDYSIEGTPQVNAPLTVNIALNTQGQGASSPVNAKVQTSAQLTSNIAVSNGLQFKSGNENQPIEMSVTPTNEGVHYININASTNVNGQMQYKAFTIPIEVGSVDWEKELKPQGTLLNDGQGGQVIVMPAQ